MEPILDSFELQNVVHFEKAVVKLKPGLTVILGHNKDSRISQSQNNGSGKSSLFSSIPSGLGITTPLANSRTDAKKNMLGDKSSFIRLNFSNFSVLQTASHWKIFDGEGKDLGVRSQKLQLEKIHSLFPITEDDFYSYVYVQSQRDCFFQVAKPDARLNFITKMFDLDNYDRLRKWFAKKLSEIKESETRYSEIEAHYLNVMQREQEIAWSDANDEEYERLTKRVTKARKNLQSLMQEIGETSTLLDTAERSAKARKRYKVLSSQIEDADASEKYAKEQIALNKSYEQYVRDKKAFDKAFKRVSEKLETLGETRPLKQLRKLHGKYSEKIEKIEEEKRVTYDLVEKRQNIVGKIKNLSKTRATYPEKLIKLKKVEAELASVSTVLSLKKLLKCDDGECPTCKQSIDVESLRESIKQAEKRSTVLLEHQRGHDIQKLIDAANEELAEIPKFELKELFHESKINDLTEKLNKVIAEGKTARDRGIYEEELASLKKPKKVQKPEIGSKEADQLLSDAREMRKLKDLIGKATENPIKLHTKLEALTASKKQLEKKFTAANERWTELKMLRTELQVLSRDREETYKKLEELQPIIERKNLIKTMEKAYGKKGLKLLAANSILGLVEKGLNEHAGLIFAEPFKFRVTADDKGVHCQVLRPNAKPCDARELSGAESDCFRLLLMVALRALMPAKKRPNFVVLDEPDSHMDDATRELFLHTFLPYLQSIIPCVNIITPFSTRYENADRVMRVVKHKGVATLETKKAA